VTGRDFPVNSRYVTTVGTECHCSVAITGRDVAVAGQPEELSL
jgi:hypothetical protein